MVIPRSGGDPRSGLGPVAVAARVGAVDVLGLVVDGDRAPLAGVAGRDLVALGLAGDRHRSSRAEPQSPKTVLN